MQKGAKTRLCFKCTSLITACIILITIMDINIFYLVKIPQALSRFWGVYNKTLLVAIVFLLIIEESVNDNRLLTRCKFLGKYFVGLIISIGIVMILSCLKYPLQTLGNTFLSSSHYFLVALAFPMLKLFVKQDGYNNLLRKINKVIFVWYCLLVVQNIVYSATGVLFLNIDFNSRSEGIRISMKSIGNLMILYNFDNYYSKRKNENRIFSLVQTLLGLYCVFAVQQTRMYIITICICLAVIILLNSTTPLKTMRNLLVLGIVVALIVNTGVLNSFLNTFNKNNEEYVGSTIARNGAMAYFWNTFISNPLYGHGIIANSAYKNIQYGPLGIYYYADIGIIGLLAQVGLFAIPIYIWPVIHWGKYSWHVIWSKSARKEKGFLLAMYVYLLCTTPTLICTNVGLSLALPFYFSIFAYDEKVRIWGIKGVKKKSNISYCMKDKY
jgi:hypothetical protein